MGMQRNFWGSLPVSFPMLAKEHPVGYLWLGQELAHLFHAQIVLMGIAPRTVHLHRACRRLEGITIESQIQSWLVECNGGSQLIV